MLKNEFSTRVFNNEGILRCPKLIDTVSDPEGKIYPILNMAASRALSRKVVSQTRAMLVKVLEEGFSFRKARYPALEVGSTGVLGYCQDIGRAWMPAPRRPTVK